MKSYVHGKISITKKNAITKKPQTPIQATDAAEGAAVPRYKGCNASIVWKDLPKLDDELILNLYKVKTMDEAKVMIRSERFGKCRRKYESSIDSSFHK